jgi:hypothetical protein
MDHSPPIRLESLARSTKTQHRTLFKARIVLIAADGAATRAIYRALGCTTGTASKWRVRYAKHRLAGFPRSEIGGLKPNTARKLAGASWLCAIRRRRMPTPRERSTDRQGARRRSHSICLALRRAYKIDLSGRKLWCISNDPEFAAKAADIVGLYMAPPNNAAVCGRAIALVVMRFFRSSPAGGRLEIAWPTRRCFADT